MYFIRDIHICYYKGETGFRRLKGVNVECKIYWESIKSGWKRSLDESSLKPKIRERLLDEPVLDWTDDWSLNGPGMGNWDLHPAPPKGDSCRHF